MFVIVFYNYENIIKSFEYRNGFKICGPFDDEHSANLWLRKNGYVCHIGGIYWRGYEPGCFTFAKVSKIDSI